MKKQLAKKVKKFAPQPKAKKSPSKPKVKLSKSDPDYYKKIGQISAQRRRMSSEQFAAMARLSHKPGVRKPKS